MQKINKKYKISLRKLRGKINFFRVALPPSPLLFLPLKKFLFLNKYHYTYVLAIGFYTVSTKQSVVLVTFRDTNTYCNLRNSTYLKSH